MANIGTAYREASGAIFIDMAAAPHTAGQRQFKQPPAADEKRLAYLPWSPWGTNNLLPQEMVADIESCGILNAIIDGKARFALGEGLAAAIVERNEEGKKVVKEFVRDAEIEDWLEANNDFLQCFGWLRDFAGLGNMGARYMLNGERTQICCFERFDLSEMRYEKADNEGRIRNIYLSKQWDAIKDAKDNRLVRLPLLNPYDPVADLREKVKAGAVEHALTVKYPGWNKNYYPVPLWYAAYKWVKIAQGVPEMKAALFQNTMRLKYKVTIFPNYWIDAYPGKWDSFSPEEKEKLREELFDEINEYLVGSRNAHKSLFVDGKWDAAAGKGYSNIEIEPIEDNTVQGEYLPDSAAANSEIAFANLFNPAILGASLPSGPYTNSQGGSNVRESVLVQVIIHEFERRMINYLLNVPKHFNGWAERYRSKGRLEFIIPATILTTTDTGGSVKPTIEKSKPQTDGADTNH